MASLCWENAHNDLVNLLVVYVVTKDLMALVPGVKEINTIDSTVGQPAVSLPYIDPMSHKVAKSNIKPVKEKQHQAISIDSITDTVGQPAVSLPYIDPMSHKAD